MGTVIQLKKQINNSYADLKNSVDNKLILVEESRKEKLNKNSGIELFSGEFWAGKKAKELGLIDGIGNADQILREKYGDDLEIKKFGKSKGWLSKKLASSENYTDKVISVLEERSIWQRYGL